MYVDSKELTEYIKSSITSIREAVDNSGFEIDKTIEFNLAVTNATEGSGGLKIYIAKAEGKLKSEEISHIKFELKLKKQEIQNFRNLNNKINPAR